MSIEKAKKIFAIVNDNKKFAYAEMPRCVILDSSITALAKVIYCYLIARCMQHEVTWISQGVMAIDLQLTRETVCRNLKALEKRGLIESASLGDGQNNVYHIKNIYKLYGELATAPWPKHEFYAKKLGDGCDARITGGVTQESQGGVTQESQGDVIRASHKVEEAQVEEFKKQKKEEEPAPTGPGHSLIIPLVKKAKTLKYEAEDLELGQEWLDFAVKENGGKRYAKWTAEEFAKELCRVRKAAELDHHLMREIFLFVLEDDFWRPNAISPAGLTTKSKNGLRKIDNIISAVKASPKYKGLRDKIKQQAAIDSYDPAKMAF